MHAILARSPIFKGLVSNEIEEILAKISFQIKEFDKNQPIVWRGDSCQNLMIVLSGSVRGEMVDNSGKVLKIEDIRPPQALAPAFLFGEKSEFPVNVTSNEPVEILIIPRSSVLEMMQNNAIVLVNYLNFLSNRARFLSDRIMFLSFRSLKEKLGQYLLEQSRQSDEFNLPVSQQELADYFGVARPSLARTIGQMQQDGLIQIERRAVKIIDKQGLIKLVSDF
jgi:CRP-like cAMP-binding protein